VIKNLYRFKGGERLVGEKRHKKLMDEQCNKQETRERSEKKAWDSEELRRTLEWVDSK